jgi:predicted RNase H-like nuclease (RuvC/YqgF family)
MLGGVIEKIIILLIASCALFSSCKTTKGSVTPSPKAFEYREIQDEIQKQQADLAITGERVKERAKGIAEGIADLETAVAADPDRAGILLPKVQSLSREAESLQMQAETLNALLAKERETTSELNTKFNEYEKKQNELIAGMGGEITALKTENKQVKGQRNTLLAIVITAVSVIAIFLAVKILRALRIIPV